MARKNPHENIFSKPFVSTEDALYLLPDLIRFEGLDKCRRSHHWIIRAFTKCEQHLHIPISIQAVASLLVAQEQEVQFESWTQGTPIWPDGIADPTTIPLLDRFNSFRLIDEEWRIAEFLSQNSKRILVPLTVATHRPLLNALKALPLH